MHQKVESFKTQTFWSISDQSIISFVNFITSLLIIRLIGVEQFGIFSFAWLFVLFSNSIQFSLISTPMMTLGPQENNINQECYFGSVIISQFIFSFISSFLIWSILYLSIFFDNNFQLNHYAFSVAICHFFYQIQDFFRRLFLIDHKSFLAFIGDFICYTGRIILIFFFITENNDNINQIFWIITFSYFLSLILFIPSIFKYNFSKINISNIFIKHWALSKWLVPSTIMRWISGNYYIIATGLILGPFYVGALKAAENIFGILNILFQAFDNFVLSQASYIYKNYPIKIFKKYLKKITIFGTLSVTSISLLILLFKHEIIYFFYDNKFYGYEYLLYFYSICYFLMMLIIPLRHALTVIKNTKPIFMAYFITSIFSIAFANFLVTSYSVTGALLGIIFTQLLILFFMIQYFLSSINKIYK